MGSPSNMRSIVKRNVVMRRMTVHHRATLPSRRIVYAALSCDSTQEFRIHGVTKEHEEY